MTRYYQMLTVAYIVPIRFPAFFVLKVYLSAASFILKTRREIGLQQDLK